MCGACEVLKWHWNLNHTLVLKILTMLRHNLIFKILFWEAWLIEARIIEVLLCVYVRARVYRVSHELRSLLRDGLPYVKLYWYNPKHLYPKLNGYWDNDQRSLKLWQLLHTNWLPNSYWNWQKYVVSVMLISVLNIKVTCEWHKAIKLDYKNSRTTVVFLLRFPSTLRRRQLSVILRRQSYSALTAVHSDVSLPGMRSGRMWRHGRRTVRRPHRSPHFSMAVNSVTVKLWI
jgi:hypothetical protein